MWELEDKENYQLDKEKLQKLTEHKREFGKLEYDVLHMKFLNSQDKMLDMDEMCVLKRFVEFMKKNT